MTNKRIMKALKDLNAYVDDDRQKLCDKIHHVELSHKRLESLLRQFVKAARTESIDTDYFNRLVLSAEAVLSYPYYRVNWKEKGGKDA